MAFLDCFESLLDCFVMFLDFFRASGLPLHAKSKYQKKMFFQSFFNNFSFFIDRSTITPKTTSRRRHRCQKDAKMVRKRSKRFKTARTSLENVPKIVRFRMGPLLRIVLKFSNSLEFDTSILHVSVCLPNASGLAIIRFRCKASRAAFLASPQVLDIQVYCL